MILCNLFLRPSRQRPLVRHTKAISVEVAQTAEGIVLLLRLLRRLQGESWQGDCAAVRAVARDGGVVVGVHARHAIGEIHALVAYVAEVVRRGLEASGAGGCHFVGGVVEGLLRAELIRRLRLRWLMLVAVRLGSVGGGT